MKEKGKYYRRRVFDEYISFVLKNFPHKIIGPSKFGSYDPFFIISPGRSGTTLIRRVIHNNPNVVIPPESDELIPAILRFYSLSWSRDWSKMVYTIVNYFEKSKINKFWILELRNNCDTILNIDKEYRNSNSLIEWIYMTYAKQRLGFKINDKFPIWGDKTPYLSFYLHWLVRVYPNAKFLIAIRNPGAVVYSRSRNFQESLQLSISRVKWFYDEIERLQRRTNKYFISRYESLVDNPEIEFRKIFNFLDLKYEDEYLRGLNTDLNDQELQHHKYVNMEIMDRGNDVWKMKMTLKEQQIIEKGLGRYMNIFN